MRFVHGLLSSVRVPPNDRELVSRLCYPLVLTANAPDCYTVRYADEHLAEARIPHRHRICDGPLIGERDTHTPVCPGDAQVLRQTVGADGDAVHRRMAACAGAVDVWHGVT